MRQNEKQKTEMQNTIQASLNVDYQLNLSDFALFMSVMKVKRAYENVLSIILDLAKYTFSEWCEEVPDLPLDDGTYKIFLNMTSKNGRPELVSLLQYMKNTNLNNSEITVQDERILDLDRIVAEVKQSEEWEILEMNILEAGIQRGIAQSQKDIVKNMLIHGMSDEDIMMYTKCEQEFIDKVRREINAD